MSNKRYATGTKQLLAGDQCGELNWDGTKLETLACWEEGVL
jgi:hypothetical protein